MEDNVPEEEKRRRFHAIEQLQAQISERKMGRWLGETVEVLVEDRHNGRWRSRTPQNKLVFFDDPRDLKGKLVQVKIEHTGAWSLSGTAVDKPRPKPQPVAESIPLSVL
jgi:tRNA-2-methylthio-N6-dimethylallyladenosine synthase